MIAEWETNCVFLAAMLRDRHPEVFHGLQKTLTAHQNELRLVRQAKDIWARDFMPIQVAEREFVKFRYDPDYLRGKHQHLISGDEVVRSLRGLGNCHRSDINLDGGNIVASGRKAILTEKIYKENSHWPRSKLRDKLRDLLRVDGLVIIPKLPLDPIGHADGIVRFINDETILVNDYTSTEPAYHDRLVKALKQHRLEVEFLPHRPAVGSKDGIPSAVGLHLNFLRTSRVLIVPTFGVKEDTVALRKLESVFSGLPLVTLQCQALAEEGGVLNCVASTYRLQPSSAKNYTDPKPTLTDC